MANKRVKGKSISIPSHSWKNDGGAVEGTIVKVVRFVGTEYEGEAEKVQCRILLEDDDHTRRYVYMPARWVDIAAPYHGAYVWITSSAPGEKKTRYDLVPEAGAKTVPIETIETVRQDGAAEPF